MFLEDVRNMIKLPGKAQGDESIHLHKCQIYFDGKQPPLREQGRTRRRRPPFQI